jgi:hypothetical protein
MRACLLEGRGIPTMLLFPEVLQETSCTAFTRRVFIPARTTNLRDGQWQERGRSLLLRQHARADPALPNGIRQPGQLRSLRQRPPLQYIQRRSTPTARRHAGKSCISFRPAYLAQSLTPFCMQPTRQSLAVCNPATDA